MGSWDNTGSANGIPLWITDQLKTGSGNAQKQTKKLSLFQNTTPNAFTNKETDGVYFLTDLDIRSMQPKPGGSAGWYLKRTGSGGRSTRVQWECLASISSAPFISNLTPATTTAIRAGYQAMLAGTRNMNVAIMGDSTDRGTDETASPYNSQYPLSIAEQLASRFRADGIPSGANNLYGISGNNFNDYMIRDGRCAATGATTAFGTAVPCQGGAEIEFPTAAGTFSFTPQQNTNTADIYYQDSTAGRAFTWAVDGGSTTTITTTGLNTIVKLTIPLGSVGAHTIQLAWSAGFVRIYGIDCYDNTRKEITIRQWATSGGTTSTMIDNTGSPSSGRLRQLALFPVDLVIGDLGLVNSWRGSRSVANCQTDIDTMIDAIKAAGGDFIFCVPPFDTGSTGATSSQQQYIDMAISRCVVKGCAIFNIRQAWVSKSASDAAGYTSAADAVHPTILGQASRAALLKPIIRYGMGI